MLRPNGVTSVVAGTLVLYVVVALILVVMNIFRIP
jgi:hypothetical protein